MPIGEESRWPEGVPYDESKFTKAMPVVLGCDVPGHPNHYAHVHPTDDPRIVKRDQCRGSTLACVNCEKPLDGYHDVLCYSYAIARQQVRRGHDRGAS